jgi:hypothetical protein
MIHPNSVHGSTYPGGQSQAGAQKTLAQGFTKPEQQRVLHPGGSGNFGQQFSILQFFFLRSLH